MLRVYDCIANQHDPWLVLLAGLICTLSTITGFNLMHRSERAGGRFRPIWLCAGAAVIGAGIWSTHFIAMLAYDPGVLFGFAAAPTGLALVVAVAMSLAGLTVAQGRRFAARPLLAGVLLGLGIGGMHYLGMAGVEVPGTITWDAVHVAASLGLGVVLAGLAVGLFAHRGTRDGRLLAGSLLAIAICALHFTGMAAVEIRLDPTVVVSDAVISKAGLALGIAAATLVIIVFATAGAHVEERMAVMRESEATRLRMLANAAVEGIAICDGDLVREVNESLAGLLGIPQAALVGMSFGRFVGSRDRARWGALPPGSSAPMEVELQAAGGEVIPSEILVRSIEHEGRPHRLLAVRDLRERKNAEARIRFLAHHDPLTELPNRALFATRLDQEIARANRAETRLAVLCLDLDRFKEINDVFGHQAGDEALRIIAESLRIAIREGDVIARLGGDEFAVVMTDDPPPAEASALSNGLIQLADRPVVLAGQAVTLGVSVGIALYPEDGTTAGELLRNADTALYRAKDDGRGTFRFFEPAMDEALRERRALQHDLRQALGRGELRLVYQPQADIRTGEIIGFEALLRWAHPQLGNVPPDRFIPLAEECGAMLPIGEWVVRQACREAACWPRPLSIAINLSPVQFQTGDLVATVRSALRDAGLDPRLLELEVTETVLIRDRERARAILHGLKGLGVRLAMDDFGTGYSSLSYLQSFPFDKIKIDRSFISNIERNRQSMTIVKAVVGLGHGLDLEVIAEGVETTQQLELLRGERCDAVQGYLLGRPDDIGRFLSTLDRRATGAAEPAASAVEAA